MVVSFLVVYSYCVLLLVLVGNLVGNVVKYMLYGLVLLGVCWCG